MMYAIILAGLAVASGKPIQLKMGRYSDLVVIAADPADPEVPEADLFRSSTHISGGAVAGITLGLIALAGLAGLLAYWWRGKRHEYMSPFDPCTTGHGHAAPTRTVVTEKIEPVVVRSTSHEGGIYPATHGVNTVAHGVNTVAHGVDTTAENVHVLPGAPVPPPHQ
ncbi:hypothetical protein BGZ76_002403 [Entomortierella beljakovae]|nr:hypothetical protein BGZ76_002403 [Entomortierella beljakovae]